MRPDDDITQTGPVTLSPKDLLIARLLQIGERACDLRRFCHSLAGDVLQGRLKNWDTERVERRGAIARRIAELTTMVDQYLP